MPVRLFVGNLPYGVSEPQLREYFGAVAQPSHVSMPVDRETGRPRGFAFVEFLDAGHAQEVIRRFNAQPFQGRPLSISEARAREDRPPGSAPRPPYRPPDPTMGGGPPPTDRPVRSFGPPARSQRGGSAGGAKKRKDEARPKGPIRARNFGRVLSIDDEPAEDTPDFDNFATSSPTQPVDDEVATSGAAQPVVDEDDDAS